LFGFIRVTLDLLDEIERLQAQSFSPRQSANGENEKRKFNHKERK
jgi:hypothetical protein